VKGYFFALVLVMTFAGAASAQDDARQLTLKEAIKLAVEKNLDVQAELYNPAVAEADIRKFKGIYDPLLTLLTNYQDSNTLPPNSFIVGGVSVNRQSALKLNAGASQLVSTGGTIGAKFDNSWNHNNSQSPGILMNYFQSDLTFSFDQPLLKNFGREATELNISVAKYNKEGSLEQLKTRLLDIISQVQTQYYQLYSLRQNLEVRKTSLTLAETILSNTQAQVKAGVLPAFEILNAQFGVATQQKNLIDAERALRDQVDSLRLLLQLPEPMDIVPADTPFRDDYQVDQAQAIQRALASRPDLKQQRFSLTTNELQSRVARNQTRPDLSLTSSAAFTGLDRNYRRDFEQTASAQYPIWTIGLQLTYPIGNNAAENDYIKSRLKVEQTRVQLRSLEETIANEVRASVRAVRSGYLQLDVTRRGRAYAEEVLQAFIKKQKVGLATTKDVLDELNNLNTAQGNEIQAVTDYNKAIVTLWRTTGELLEREGITLGEKEAGTLYENNRK
jgi:outer membrane protein